MTGVPIGHIDWHVDIGNNFYETSSNGKASGVLSVLMNGEGSVATSGRIVTGQMTPTYFTSNIVDENGKTELRVTYDAGVAEALIIQPAPLSDGALSFSYRHIRYRGQSIAGFVARITSPLTGTPASMRSSARMIFDCRPEELSNCST